MTFSEVSSIAERKISEPMTKRVIVITKIDERDTNVLREKLKKPLLIILFVLVQSMLIFLTSETSFRKSKSRFNITDTQSRNPRGRIGHTLMGEAGCRFITHIINIYTYHFDYIT